MSIVILNSKDQDPAEFVNDFRLPLEIEPNSEIAILGYCLNLLPNTIEVASQNNQLLWNLGLNDRDYPLHELKLDPASFLISNGGTTTADSTSLRRQLQEKLNDAHYRGLSRYYNPVFTFPPVLDTGALNPSTSGWTCWNGAPANPFAPDGKLRLCLMRMEDSRGACTIDDHKAWHTNQNVNYTYRLDNLPPQLGFELLNTQGGQENGSWWDTTPLVVPDVEITGIATADIDAIAVGDTINRNYIPTVQHSFTWNAYNATDLSKWYGGYVIAPNVEWFEKGLIEESKLDWANAKQVSYGWSLKEVAGGQEVVLCESKCPNKGGACDWDDAIQTETSIRIRPAVAGTAIFAVSVVYGSTAGAFALLLYRNSAAVDWNVAARQQLGEEKGNNHYNHLATTPLYGVLGVNGSIRIPIALGTASSNVIWYPKRANTDNLTEVRADPTVVANSSALMPIKSFIFNYPDNSDPTDPLWSNRFRNFTRNFVGKVLGYEPPFQAIENDTTYTIGFPATNLMGGAFDESVGPFMNLSMPNMALIQIPNLPIRSYAGVNGDIQRVIGVVERRDEEANVLSNWYEYANKNWIKLYNSDVLHTNQLQVRITDIEGKKVEWLDTPATIWVQFRCNHRKDEMY